MDNHAQSNNPLTAEEQQLLLKLARQSIEHGLQHRRALAVEAKNYSAALREKRPVFVTLHRHLQLRGCIGTLEANDAIVENVVRYAYYSAFQDARFLPVTWEEFPDLEIQVSILSLPEPMQFASEADLLNQIRPGIDGLIFMAGFNRGTFLPSVWESLPDKMEFWRQLKRKASLPPDYWDDTVQVSRYTSFCFSDK